MYSQPPALSSVEGATGIVTSCSSPSARASNGCRSAKLSTAPQVTVAGGFGSSNVPTAVSRSAQPNSLPMVVPGPGRSKANAFV